MKTVIQKAKELVKSVGPEEAIAMFQQRIEKIGKPKNFEDVCTLSGCEVAIEFIKKGKNEQNK